MRIGEYVRTAGVVLRNAFLGISLSAVPLLLHPRQFVNYVSECLFLLQGFGDSRGIVHRNIHDILPSSDIENIKLGALMSNASWLASSSSYLADLVNLCLLCRAVRPRVVFEIGTLTGYTALNLALNAPDDAVVYTLDLPREESRTNLHTTLVDDEHIKRRLSVEQCCFENTVVERKISRLYGDSAAFDFSPFHQSVDLFFIDGAHSYEYVRSDTMNALKCCREGSAIAWHDFGRVGVNGVTRFLVDFSRQHQVYVIPGGSLAFTVVKRVIEPSLQ